METTLTVYNQTSLGLLKPQVVLTWLRSQVATRLAANSHEWASYFRRHSSGSSLPPSSAPSLSLPRPPKLCSSDLRRFVSPSFLPPSSATAHLRPPRSQASRLLSPFSSSRGGLLTSLLGTYCNSWTIVDQRQDMWVVEEMPGLVHASSVPLHTCKTPSPRPTLPYCGCSPFLPTSKKKPTSFFVGHFAYKRPIF